MPESPVTIPIQNKYNYLDTVVGDDCSEESNSRSGTGFLSGAQQGKTTSDWGIARGKFDSHGQPGDFVDIRATGWLSLTHIALLWHWISNMLSGH